MGWVRNLFKPKGKVEHNLKEAAFTDKIAALQQLPTPKDVEYGGPVHKPSSAALAAAAAAGSLAAVHPIQEPEENDAENVTVETENMQDLSAAEQTHSYSSSYDGAGLGALVEAPSVNDSTAGEPAVARPPSPRISFYGQASADSTSTPPRATTSATETDADSGIELASTSRTRSAIERAAAALIRSMSPRKSSRPSSPARVPPAPLPPAQREASPAKASPQSADANLAKSSSSDGRKGLMGWLGGSPSGRSRSPARSSGAAGIGRRGGESAAAQTRPEDVAYGAHHAEEYRRRSTVQKGLFRNMMPAAVVLQQPQPLTEDQAATRIQAAFRGYLARKALRALRALVRVQARVRGYIVRKQARETLRALHALVRLQARFRGRLVRNSPEGQFVRRQLEKIVRKYHPDVTPLLTDGGWVNTTKSVEDIRASRQKKYEGMVRRERARAYADAHARWRKEKELKLQQEAERRMEADLEAGEAPPDMIGGWGWAWLERWMIARPWEHRLMMAHYQTILAAHAMAHQQPEEPAVAEKGRSDSAKESANGEAGPNFQAIGTLAHRYRETGGYFELVTVGKCKSCGRRIRVKPSVAAAAAAAADALEKAEEAAAVAEEWKQRMEEEGEEGLTSEETQQATEAAEAAAAAAERAAQAASFPPLAHLDMCNICVPTVSWAAKLGALPPAETLADGNPVGLLSTMDVAHAGATPTAANGVARITSASTAASPFHGKFAPPRSSAPARPAGRRGSGSFIPEPELLEEDEEEEGVEQDYSHLPRFMQPTTAARSKVKGAVGTRRASLGGNRTDSVTLADSSRNFAESLRSNRTRRTTYEELNRAKYRQTQGAVEEQVYEEEQQVYEEEQVHGHEEEEHGYEGHEEQQHYEGEEGHEGEEYQGGHEEYEYHHGHEEGYGHEHAEAY